MILIDYNGVAVGTFLSQKGNMVEEGLLRVMILNQIRMYRKKYFKEYGEVVVVADGGGNFRKEIFPQYKWRRSESREESSIDWNEAFRILSVIFDEIAENFPYKTIRQWGCEADDTIARIAFETQEFGKHENVMIISGDHDFIQLQKMPNVKQFSPITKKAVTVDDPHRWTMEKIFKGCGSDAVPNILSPDNAIADGIRQRPMTKKKMDAWINADDMRKEMGEEIYRNFCRNKKLVDLTETPENIKQEIINTYEAQDPHKNKGKVFPYLVKNRCRLLLECVQEFI